MPTTPGSWNAAALMSSRSFMHTTPKGPHVAGRASAHAACLVPSHLDEGGEPGIQVLWVQLGQRYQPLPVVPLPVLCGQAGRQGGARPGQRA